MPERTLETKLRYTADQGSVQSVIRAIERVEDAFEDVRKEIKRNEDAQTSMERTSIRVAQAQTNSLDQQRRLAREQADIYGDLASRTSAFSGLASGLGGGALGGRIMIAADLLDAVEAGKLFGGEIQVLSDRLLSSGKLTTGMVNALQQYIPGMSAAAAKTTVMVASLGAMAAASAAVLIAFGKAKEIIDESAEATNKFIEVNQRFAEVIATSTTPEVEETIRKNEERNRALAIERDLLQRLVDEAENTEGFAGALLDVNDALGLNLGGQEDVINRLKEVNAEYDNNIDLNEWLARALAEGATAANDAIAAEERLAQARSDQAKWVVDNEERAVTERIELWKRERDWSSEQVQRRLEEIELERKAREEQLQNLQLDYEGGQLSDAEFDAAKENIEGILRALASEADSLPAVLEAVRAREELVDIEEQITRISQEQTDAWKEYRDIAREIADIQEDVNDKLATLTARYNQEAADREADYQRQRERQLEDFEYNRARREQDYQRQREEAARQHQDRLNDIQQQYQDDLAKARDEYQKDELKRLADYNLERQRAQEDHERNLQDAAARLDAVAVIREIQNYDKDQKRAKEDYDRQEKERREAYQQQLRDLEKSLKDQLDAENKSYQKQEQQAEDAYREAERRQKEAFDRQLAQQQQEYQRQQDERTAQYQRELDAIRADGQNKITELQNQQAALKTQLQNWLTDEYNLRAAHYQALRDQLKNALNNAGGGSGSTLPTRYQMGGYAFGQQIWTDPGEFMLTRKTAQSLEKGLGTLNQTKIQNLVQGDRTNSISVQQNFGDIGRYSPAQMDKLVRGSMVRVLREAGNTG